MVPGIIEGARKVGEKEVPPDYRLVKEDGNIKYYEKITETPATKTEKPGSKKPSSGGGSKPKAAAPIKSSGGGATAKPKPTPPAAKITPGKRERDLIYTEMMPPAVEKPTPIKAFIGEHIFGPNNHAFGAIVNVSRESADAARQSGLVGPDQEDIFVKYIPGTATPDMNNVYRLPKGVFPKITGGTIAVQSQEGMDLLEKFKVDPKTVEGFKNRMTWTSHL